MNTELRKIINSHCHRVGLQYGLDLRDKMVKHARRMWHEGKTTSEIAEALGIQLELGISNIGVSSDSIEIAEHIGSSPCTLTHPLRNLAETGATKTKKAPRD